MNEMFCLFSASPQFHFPDALLVPGDIHTLTVQHASHSHWCETTWTGEFYFYNIIQLHISPPERTLHILLLRPWHCISIINVLVEDIPPAYSKLSYINYINLTKYNFCNMIVWNFQNTFFLNYQTLKYECHIIEKDIEIIENI